MATNHLEAQFHNRLLARMDTQDHALIAPHLKQLYSQPNDILYNPGQNVETVYFPSGPTIVSFLVHIDNGVDVETMQVGNEGAVGGIVSHGHLPAFSRIMVQSGGHFLTLPVDVLEHAKRQSPRIDRLFARYADCLLAQVLQSTACNATHSAEARAAKWLLSAMARTGRTEVTLTQERLGAMLGVGRSYVARLLSTLKRDGILEIRRGRIVVRDDARLKNVSCTCDDIVGAHFDKVLGDIYPRT